MTSQPNANQHGQPHAEHHDPHGHPPEGQDRVAAFTGLIVGGILLFALLSTIVTITTKHYERIEKASAPAATS
jgi:hypothetical protein